MGRKIIICPSVYKVRAWNDPYLFLFDRMRTEFGFEIQFTDNPDIPVDTDLVFVFAIPQHDRVNLMVKNILNIPSHTKIIAYMRDLQTYDNMLVNNTMRLMFKRYDLILSPSKQVFEDLYPEFVDKMVFFPDFFAPYERYSRLEINKEPIQMCLLSGAFNPRVYTIRDYIINNGNGDKIVHIPPPYPPPFPFQHDFKGDKYAGLLNQFECCVTESGIYPYVVTKCLEIPAAGSLLLTNYVRDMDLMAFIPNIHYIPITKENVLTKIDEVLENPGRFSMIKREGRKFVQSFHSLNNRIGQFRDILKEGV